VVLLVLVVVVSVGVVVARHVLASPAGTSGTRPHTGDLSQYVVQPPPGSKPWVTKPGDQALTLEQVASFAQNPSQRARILRRYQFRRGFVRRWVGSDGSIVELRLYQFGSPRLAHEFYVEDKLLDGIGWGHPSSVPAVPGGLTYVRTTVDAQNYAQTLSLAVAGDVSVALITNQLAPAQADVANQILVGEYPLL
jgi:hypothetical protein